MFLGSSFSQKKKQAPKEGGIKKVWDKSDWYELAGFSSKHDTIDVFEATVSKSFDARDFVNKFSAAGDDLLKKIETFIWSYVLNIKKDLNDEQKLFVQSLITRAKGMISIKNAREEAEACTQAYVFEVRHAIEPDYKTLFAQYGEEDKERIGYECMHNSLTWRKNFKGTIRTLILKNSKIEIYIARDNDPIDENIITYSRAVNGTCIQVAKLLSKNNQVTKIGANIGWHALYKNEQNILKLFEKQFISYKKFFIPLVTSPQLSHKLKLLVVNTFSLPFH